MDATQHLYYALGQLSYAVAKSDGKVQKEERKKIHEIVKEETARNHPDYDYTEIIFHILTQQKMDLETTYNWAIKEMKLCSHKLTPELKDSFIRVIEKVADSFPPTTSEEKEVINRFRQDIKNIG